MGRIRRWGEAQRTARRVSAEDGVGRLVAAIEPLDADGAAAARARNDQLVKPRGSLGRLEEAGAWLASVYGSCPPPVPQRPAAVVCAGDHGVLAQGVSAWPKEVTAIMVGEFCAERAAVNTLGRTVGASVTVLDVGVASDVPAHPRLKRSRVEVVGRALERHAPDPEDGLGTLATLGGLEHAAIVGLILGAAARRVPVILDGVSTVAAALVARAICPVATGYVIAGHRSTEPAATVALEVLGLEPLLDLRMRLGEATGALLAVPIVRASAAALSAMATFEEAGIAT
jgi:NaMN:DMB phosphoribosyltransferase